MSRKNKSKLLTLGKCLAVLITCFIPWKVFAQAPTNLSYPTPNVYVVNYSRVNLYPTVAGVVTSYSISPATLPTGLSFNTNNGSITGIPTDTLGTTSYTITANNASGSSSKVISLRVFNNLFNNVNNPLPSGQVSFANPTYPNGGNGTASVLNDLVLYTNVVTLNGTQIDCIVTLTSLVSGTVTTFDQPLVTDNPGNPAAGLYNNNSPNFFSPQLSFSATPIPAATPGSATFNFQFILGGSYDPVTKTGVNVTLQNVKLNTYDIDGNNTYAQYNAFGGFNTSELGTTTNETATYDAATGLTKYTSTPVANTVDIQAPANRIRLSYNNMSNFSIVVGAGGRGAAYYFLDFSTGFAGFTTNTTIVPSIDLNTAKSAVSNDSTNCGAALAFTGASQTNVQNPAVTTTPVGTVTVSIPAAQLVNTTPAGSEQLLVYNGATLVRSIPLDDNAAVTNFTIGGATYSATKTLANGIRTVSFNEASFTAAEAEQLLDGLRYSNTATAATNGPRNFTVNMFSQDGVFKSPDALFIANVNCLTISGNLWHDADGLSVNNTINSNGTPTTLPGTMNAILTDPANGNLVVAKVAVDASGAYTFSVNATKIYELLFAPATTAGPLVAGTSNFTASVYPASTTAPTNLYKSVGENLGLTAGTDGLANGILRITVGNESVLNANFGLELPPVALLKAKIDLPNPGGYNGYTLAATDLAGTDEDGTVASVIINSFPSNANYLKVGTTIYTTTGSICPPQSSCVTFPATGGVTVPVADINTISIDPAGAATLPVVINYTAVDNAGISGNTTTSSFTFKNVPGVDVFTVSGSTWNDANGNAIVDAGENLVAPANSGETLFAVLVQTSGTYSGNNTVFASAAVTGSGYTFTNSVPANNTYQVRIISALAAPEVGSNAGLITQSLPTGWVGVSYRRNPTTPLTTPNQNTTTPSISIPTLTANATEQNFGIERISTADAKTFTAPASSFTSNATPLINGKTSYSINGNSTSLSGSAVKSLSGTDPEDCAAASGCTTARSYRIQTIKPNTLVYYNSGSGSVLVTAGTTIANFNPANMTIYGERGQGNTAGTALGFTYSLVDNAGIASAPVAYSLQSTGTPLPVSILALSAVRRNHENVLNWKSGTELNMASFDAERSTDGKDFRWFASAQPKGRNSAYEVTDETAASVVYYRLKLSDLDGHVSYSSIVSVKAGEVFEKAVVSPVPATSNIRVSGLQGIHNMEIIDLSGRVVLQADKLTDNQMIDISALSAGVFTIRLNNAGGSIQYLKLIKN